jgi:hypothetical protein
MVARPLSGVSAGTITPATKTTLGRFWRDMIGLSPLDKEMSAGSTGLTPITQGLFQYADQDPSTGGY